MKYIRCYFPVIVVVIVSTLLTNCTKKRCELKFEMEKCHPVTLDATYYAYSDKNSAVVSFPIPLTEGKWEGTLPVDKPTVVILYKDAIDIAAIFYAGKGDALSVTGDCSDPFSWNVTGNDESEEIALWRKENKKALASHDPKIINAAIRKLSRKHPDRISTAVLAIVYFDRSFAPEEFRKIWDSFSDDVKNSDVVRSLGATGKFGDSSAGKNKITHAGFYSHGDSLIKWKASDSRYTVFLFWEKGGQHKSAVSRLKDQISGKRGVTLFDVNMSADTIGWHKRIVSDSTVSWHNVWTPGAEVNQQISLFDVPRGLYFIAVDSLGRQIYRGDGPDGLSKKIR